MSIGKWDHLCTYVREQAKADGAVVIVLNKDMEQAGFSVQAPLQFSFTLPEMLRHLADVIEADLKQGKL